MAMRVNVLAVRTADRARVAARTGGTPWSTGDWTVALTSAWAMGQLEAGWCAALLAREMATLSLRATTVDDAFVDLQVFWKGEPAVQLAHHYGGLLASPISDGENTLDWDSAPDAATVARIGSDSDHDPELMAAASGRTLRAAAAEVAHQRAERLALAAERAGAVPDRAALERLLLGKASAHHDGDGGSEDAGDETSAHEDPLEAWGDVPALLEAAGITGFRSALLARSQEESAAEAGSGEAEAAPRGKSGGARRLLGCAVILALFGAGGGLGFWKGGALGAVGGAFLGGLVVAALVGLRVWQGIRAVKQLVGAGSTEGPRLAPSVRAKLARPLALWRMIAARFGAQPPGGIFGQLYPSAMPPTDPPARGLVALAEGKGLAEAERRLGQLWTACLDAEIQKKPREPLKRQYEQLTAWLTAAAGSKRG